MPPFELLHTHTQDGSRKWQWRWPWRYGDVAIAMAMAMACRVPHNGQKEDASQVPPVLKPGWKRRGNPQVGGWGVANVITAQCNLVSERGEQETRCMPREHEQHGS